MASTCASGGSRERGNKQSISLKGGKFLNRVTGCGDEKTNLCPYREKNAYHPASSQSANMCDKMFGLSEF